MPQLFDFGETPLTFPEMLTGGNKNRPLLPVFFMHTIENPFCNVSGSPCQLGKLKAQAYIELAEWGQVVIRPVGKS